MGFLHVFAHMMMKLAQVRASQFYIQLLPGTRNWPVSKSLPTAQFLTQVLPACSRLALPPSPKPPSFWIGFLHDPASTFATTNRLVSQPHFHWSDVCAVLARSCDWLVFFSL